MESNKTLNQEKNKVWKDILNLTKEEAKKCRFICIDPSFRLFACKTHNQKHGLRLHPPHKFEIKNGVVYKRLDKKLKVWYADLYAKKNFFNRGRSENRGANSGVS